MYREVLKYSFSIDRGKKYVNPHMQHKIIKEELERRTKQRKLDIPKKRQKRQKKYVRKKRNKQAIIKQIRKHTIKLGPNLDSTGDIVQDSQWMPETEDSRRPYTDYIHTIYTYTK